MRKNNIPSKEPGALVLCSTDVKLGKKNIIFNSQGQFYCFHVRKV